MKCRDQQKKKMEMNSTEHWLSHGIVYYLLYELTYWYCVLKVLISTNINKANNYLSPKINEQHKKERRKDLPWGRHKYMEVLNWLIGFPSPPLIIGVFVI